MIDRRDISYTQGSPLTPIHKGVLVVKPKDSLPHIESGGLVSRATPSKPKKKATVIDTIGALGIGGLAKVYVAGGAYGSKEAVKTTFTEVAKGQGLPPEPLIDLWKTQEWKDWQPKATLPVVGEIPSIQIDPAKPFDLGLPSWEELKKPLLIAGIVGAGLLLLPTIIGAFKK